MWVRERVCVIWREGGKEGVVYKAIKAGLTGVIKLNKWGPMSFVISGFMGFPLGSLAVKQALNDGLERKTEWKKRKNKISKRKFLCFFAFLNLHAHSGAL